MSVNSLLVDHLFLCGDSLEILKEVDDNSIDCIITSPPYWNQRIYKDHEKELIGIIGTEDTVDGYVKNLMKIIDELYRVLKPSGSFWLNLGDKYFNKNLVGVPWRVALAMQEKGWILRDDIIWDKMKGTQSAKDRFRDIYEHVFHFVKSHKYYFNPDPVRIEPKKKPKVEGDSTISATGVSGKKYRKMINDSEFLTEDEKQNALNALDETLKEIRLGLVNDFRMTIRGGQRIFQGGNVKMSGRAKEINDRGYFILKMYSKGFLPSNIWRIVPEDKVRKDSHDAVFPEELLVVPIKSTCPDGGIVLDPFSGTGSSVVIACKLGRKGIGIDISSEYTDIAKKRIKKEIK